MSSVSKNIKFFLLNFEGEQIRKVGGGVACQTDISFIKVQKVHSVIKSVVRIFSFFLFKKKELRELPHLLDQQGKGHCLTYFWGIFCSFLYKVSILVLASHPQLASRAVKQN